MKRSSLRSLCVLLAVCIVLGCAPTASAEGTTFTKYALTEAQLIAIARVCEREQGTVTGAKAEASLMANQLETSASRQKKYGTGADGLYNWVRNGGWFHKSAYWMDHASVSPAVVEGVRDVLVNGNRTLPWFIDEHDCLSDITSVSTGSVRNKSAYIQDKTIVKNVYGGTWIFWCFPDSHADPFGYTPAAYKAVDGRMQPDAPAPSIPDDVANAQRIPAVVIAAGADVYDTAGKHIGTLAWGERVNVVKINGEWALIERNGAYGVCLAASLTPEDTDEASGEQDVFSAGVSGIIKADEPVPATVVADKLEVRGADGKLLGTLRAGAKVNVLAARDSTYALIELNGRWGICLLSGLKKGQQEAAEAVQPDASSSAIDAVVTAASVSVYNISGKVLGTLHRGAAVRILAVKDGKWALVEKDGNKGICLLSALGKPGSAATDLAGTTGIYRCPTPVPAVVATPVAVYNISGKTLGTLPKGLSVSILAVRDGKWALIEKSGNHGICALSALTVKTE